MELEPKVKHVLAAAVTCLDSSGIDCSQLEAELMLQFVLGVNKAGIYLDRGRILNEQEHKKFVDFINKRTTRKPLEYIIGQAQFYGFWLVVSEKTLVPRPETEVLVEYVIKTYQDKRLSRIIDLGTGCGNIAVLLAKNFNSEVYATDISLKALEVACKNVERFKLVSKIEFFLSDWLTGIDISPVDLIVSNPPYIAEQEWEQLPPEVKDFEPREALWGGFDGLDSYRQIIPKSPGFLRPGGRLILEVAWNKAGAVKQIIKGTGWFSEIEIIKDLAGRERIVSAIRK